MLDLWLAAGHYPGMSKHIHTITHGCRLNLRESEVMAELARKAGLDHAVLINTCAVTNEAARQSRQSVRKAVRENPGTKIIVTGCAAQIAPQDFQAIDGVERILGNVEKMRPESYRQPESHDGNEITHVSDIMKARRRSAPLPPQATPARARAIVEVQTGCDHRCTFCIIPYGRGNSRSVEKAAIISQIKALRAAGMNEIVLSGVDISSWGSDLEGTPKPGELVADILNAVPDLPRLRLSSIDPAEIDETLIALIGSEPRLCPYLHLSIQHGDNLILKRMKRRHSREQAIELCRNLRKARPDISFGADLIAGFPTETEAMFENTLRIIEECGLNWLHVFPYSARTGTPAAKMPQVNGRQIKARAKALREAGNTARTAFLKSRAYGHDLALIEKTPQAQKHGLGRLADFSPVRLPVHNLAPGSLHPVRITGYDETTLIGDFV